jgi:hypothetical protein
MATNTTPFYGLAFHRNAASVSVSDVFDGPTHPQPRQVTLKKPLSGCGSKLSKFVRPQNGHERK